MTIEEKAKAYDEALKKLHEIITMDNHPVLPKEIGEFLFPELAESEDERIRKILIHIVKGACDKYGIKYKGDEITEEKLLAYLEKQKEQEQSEVDLEKFTEKIDSFKERYKNNPERVSIKGAMAFMARLFYQYPAVAREWYENLPEATMGRLRKINNRHDENGKIV